MWSTIVRPSAASPAKHQRGAGAEVAGGDAARRSAAATPVTTAVRRCRTRYWPPGDSIRPRAGTGRGTRGLARGSMPSDTDSQRRPLGLNVGGNARIRLGDDVDGAEPPAGDWSISARTVRSDSEPKTDLSPSSVLIAIVHSILAPAARSLASTAARCSGTTPVDGGRAAGDGGRQQQRGRLDPVGNQAGALRRRVDRRPRCGASACPALRSAPPGRRGNRPDRRSPAPVPRDG